MDDTVSGRVRRLAAILVTLSIGLAACSGASSPSAVSGGSTSSGSGTGVAGAPTDTGAAGSPGGAAGASTDTGAAGSPGGTTVTGSLVSSGLYNASWTWSPGNEAGPGIIGVTLTSDKGTFGSIEVLDDGSITFTSGAPELHSGSYKGTGAQVHMKDASGAQLPCGWTLDNDVTGSDGVIHLKGTMDIVGTSFDCPK